MRVNYKQLLEQDKQAKEFVKDAIYAIFISDKNCHSLIGSIHTFYNMGMTVEEITTWFRNMKMLEETDEST